MALYNLSTKLIIAVVQMTHGLFIVQSLVTKKKKDSDTQYEEADSEVTANLSKIK